MEVLGGDCAKRLPNSGDQVKRLEQQFISVARVAGVQGLNGEIKVQPLSDRPERFTTMAGKDLLWRRGEEFRRVLVQSVRAQGRFYVLSLDGYTTRTAAQDLFPGELVVTECELLPLPEGHYYIYQLIGLSVYDEHGTLLGKVKEVLQPGSNDVYVVSGARGEILLPALKSVIKVIDITRGEIHATLPPGLVDES